MKDDKAHFLHNHLPFSLLPAEQIQVIGSGILAQKVPAGQNIITSDSDPAEYLYIVRQGSVEMLREDGQDITFSDILHEGELFGALSLIRGKTPEVTVRSREDTLLYLLPATTFHHLRCMHLDFARYIDNGAFDRLLHFHQRRGVGDDPEFRIHLHDILDRKLVCVAPQLSVQEAARLMKHNDVRYIIVDGSEPGIVTNHNLRNVLIDGLNYDTPVEQIMTTPLLTMPADSLVFEGLILLLEHNFRHLPVTENGHIIGVVTHTDILRHLSQNPLFLPRQLMRARRIDDYQRYAEQVTKAVGSLLQAGARIHDIGRMVAVSHSSMLRRMLRQAEMDMGPPPCPYAWIVFGSEGRYEQTLRTDQDNALIYTDDAPSEAEDYFAALAERVIEQLVACGFPRCAGDYMATNPKWRQPLHVWKRYFEDWIHLPDEQALMRASIFFDYRQIAGTLDIEKELRPIIHDSAKNGNFLRRLAKNALRQKPPISGWFRNFVVDHDEEKRSVLNLKERGTALIVDLARLYAIEAGCIATNTLSRLHLAVPRSNLSEKGAGELAVAFEHISLLRLRHQYAQMERGETPDNLIPISQLSALERKELKEAFRAIENIQQGAAASFGTSWVM